MGLSVIPKSEARQISQIPSAEAKEPETRSDSIDERAMRFCFFEAQDIGEPLNVNNQPEVDRRVAVSEAQSASEYPVTKPEP